MTVSTDIKRNALLLDCTFGLAAEDHENRFNETFIRKNLPLIQESRIDVLEYGVLCGFQTGPNCTVFSTTELPSCIRKMQDQYYCVILDKVCWPDVSKLPERSDETADIVRVRFDSANVKPSLEYCIQLKKKGYLIAALIDEIFKYSAEELRLVLAEICAITPWSVCIADTSGVLNESELHTVISVLDKNLPSGTLIEFHGKNNMQEADKLARLFLDGSDTSRVRCLDVAIGSAADMSEMPSGYKYAKFLNDSTESEYLIPILEYLSSDFELWKNQGNEASSRLTDYLTAREHCSAKYGRYYESLHLDERDYPGVYSMLNRDYAFEFKISEANKALAAYRKQQLDISIVYLTNGNHDFFSELFLRHISEFQFYGVHLAIYDCSKDECIKDIVENYTLDGYTNLKYVHLDEELNPDSYGRVMFKVLSELKGHDYIWMLRDDLFPVIKGFYYELLELCRKKCDLLALDVSALNGNRRIVKEYGSVRDFFAENSARLALVGSCIFSERFLEALIETYNASAGSRPQFQMAKTVLEAASSDNFQTGLLISDTFYYLNNTLPDSFLELDVIDTWAVNWYGMIMELPEIYDNYKTFAARFQRPGIYPFRIRSMCNMRGKKLFNYSIYKKYRDKILESSDTSNKKLLFSALMPAFIARAIINGSKNVSDNPNNIISRILLKLLAGYRKLVK